MRIDSFMLFQKGVEPESDGNPNPSIQERSPKNEKAVRAWTRPLHERRAFDCSLKLFARSLGIPKRKKSLGVRSAELGGCGSRMNISPR
jgi:hypothetical protein